MKTQIKKELHTKTVAELVTQLKDARENLRVLRLEKEMGRLKNTSALSQKRVEIAVVNTIIKEKAFKENAEKEIKTEDKPTASKAGKGGKK
jgi:ribosomal protein L29